MLLVLQQNMLLGDAAPTATVPDVVGDTQAAGTAEIEAEGFVVAVATAYSSTVAAGVVISQDPLAGATAVVGSTVTITVSLGPQVVVPGGRGRGPKRRERRRRYYVEIDGQQFLVDSQAEAQALLDHARALAERAAEKAAERVVEHRKDARKHASKVEPVKLEPPSIAASPELQLDLTSIREQLQRVYADVAMALEMRMLLERQAQQDEEEAIFLLM